MKAFRRLGVSVFSVIVDIYCFLSFSSVADCAVVNGYSQTITSEYFAELAAREIDKYFASIGEVRRYEAKLFRAPQAMNLPSGKVICEVKLPDVIRYSASNPITISVYINDRFFRKAVCYYRVALYDEIMVLTRNMRIEQMFTENDLRIEEREVSLPSSNYIHSYAEVEGLVPSKTLHMGQELRTSMLQMPIVVETGMPITLVCTTGSGVQVKVDGIALQKGRVGKVIRVRNRASGKELRGKVIDASTVAIGVI